MGQECVFLTVCSLPVTSLRAFQEDSPFPPSSAVHVTLLWEESRCPLSLAAEGRFGMLCVVSQQQEGPGLQQRDVGVGGGFREDLSARE